MEGVATTWLAWSWWRSYLSPQDHTLIRTIFSGLTIMVRLRQHVLFVCTLALLHMLIMLIVMWYPCKHALFYLVDHGNLIGMLYTMVGQISLLWFIRIKLLLYFLCLLNKL